MLLSKHVYCVAVTFKMTERVEQQIRIRFCVKLEHPPWKLFRSFRRLHLWQLVIGSFVMPACPLMQHVSCRVFLVKYQITKVTQPSLQPRFGTQRLLAFPQTKTTFERKEISYCQRDSGKYSGAADGDWENCEVTRCLL